jgi:hypothetical protein
MSKFLFNSGSEMQFFCLSTIEPIPQNFVGFLFKSFLISFSWKDYQSTTRILCPISISNVVDLCFAYFKFAYFKFAYNLFHGQLLSRWLL